MASCLIENLLRKPARQNKVLAPPQSGIPFQGRKLALPPNYIEHPLRPNHAVWINTVKDPRSRDSRASLSPGRKSAPRREAVSSGEPPSNRGRKSRGALRSAGGPCREDLVAARPSAASGEGWCRAGARQEGRAEAGSSANLPFEGSARGGWRTHARSANLWRS